MHTGKNKNNKKEVRSFEFKFQVSPCRRPFRIMSELAAVPLASYKPNTKDLNLFKPH